MHAGGATVGGFLLCISSPASPLCCLKLIKYLRKSNQEFVLQHNQFRRQTSGPKGCWGHMISDDLSYLFSSSRAKSPWTFCHKRCLEVAICAASLTGSPVSDFTPCCRRNLIVDMEGKQPHRRWSDYPTA